jgi:hypothetical protein
MTVLEKVKKAVKDDQKQELTPEQLEKYKKTLKEDITKLMSIDDEVISEKKETSDKAVINYIKIGHELLKARQTLYGKIYDVIDESIMKRKTIQRYTKLILTVDSAKAFSVKGNKSQKTINGLKADERLIKLIEDGVDNLKSPSFTKINYMKELSDDNFKLVLNGENEPYTALMKKKKAEREQAEFEKEEELNKEMQPKGMDEKVYQDLLDSGIHYVIEDYHNSMNENKELKKQNERLSELLRLVNVQNEVYADVSGVPPMLHVVGE